MGSTLAADFIEQRAQIGEHFSPVPVQDIRALDGVAAAEGERALIFTSGSITVEGLAFATRVQMPLIRTTP